MPLSPDASGSVCSGVSSFVAVTGSSTSARSRRTSSWSSGVEDHVGSRRRARSIRERKRGARPGPRPARPNPIGLPLDSASDRRRRPRGRHRVPPHRHRRRRCVWRRPRSPRSATAASPSRVCRSTRPPVWCPTTTAGWSTRPTGDRWPEPMWRAGSSAVPTGFIGTNKSCAMQTVSRLVDDFNEGLLTDPVGRPWCSGGARPRPQARGRRRGRLACHRRGRTTARRSRRPAPG